nr:2-C-methyl-D-erythritol 4-phosphate cytidylyltransferase [Sedimentibacter sp.]
MYIDKKVTAIIVAAGKGSRMKSEIPKQYMTIAGKTILDSTIYKFEKNNYVDDIILVVNKDELEFVKNNIACDYEKIIRVLGGGRTRTESVYEGIKMVGENAGILLIHDGVRPFISYKLINTCVENAYNYKSCIPTVNVIDTIKTVKDGVVINTLDRDNLRAAQTPQAFDYYLIRECYDMAVNENKDVNFTDDASIVEYYGHKVRTIEGLSRNIKITTPLDLKIAEILSTIY